MQIAMRGLESVWRGACRLARSSRFLSRPLRGTARLVARGSRRLGGPAHRAGRIHVPRRLVELIAGGALLPLGAAMALAVTATSGPGAPPVQGPPLSSADSLVHFHILSLDDPLAAGSLNPSPPALTSLPPAPPLSQIHETSGTEIPTDTYTTAEIEAIITAAAQADGVDPSWMIRTAHCESTLNPDAYNPSGPYYGLFQFVMSTFQAHGGTSIWDPVQQSTIAASMFASGESSAWPVCSHA